MLSLPLIPPQSDFLRSQFQPRSNSPPPRSNGSEQPHHRQPRHDTSSAARSSTHAARAPLALLTADENAITARKNAIRNFGASWIRPPGVPKTLQAQREEEAEMAEQEELARQEQGLRDLQARQQVEEANARAQIGEAEAEGEPLAERDLDEDIPDADADADAHSETGDVTFNEDSLVDGSRIAADVDQEQYGALEEAELTGAARDEEELGVDHERNLDDSVPEAGSYQHTDTEEEASSFDEDDDDGSSDLQDSFAAQSARRAPPRQLPGPAQTPVTSGALQGGLPAGLQERMRAQMGSGAEPLPRSPGSLNLSSSLLDNSFVASSPAMQRGRGGRRRGRWS